MEVDTTAIGVVLLVASGIYFWRLRHRAVAGRWREAYYRERPEGAWGPQWFRWHWRPGSTQAFIFAFSVSGLLLLTGVAFLLTGVN
jgi:hypothetical protein